MRNKSQKLHNILLQIVERKKQDLIEKMQKVPLEVLRIKNQESRIKEKKIMLHDSLLMIPGNEIAIIAEIKFASPTNPGLGSREELLERAKKYEKAGANAISIITEPHFFKGDISFVSQVKKKINLPVLQKDFVIDVYQIYEAKNTGSDALLLIARLLDSEALKSFVKICNNLGIEPVVEINNEEDLKKAIVTDTKIIAVNARDLETFAVDVNHACNVMKKIPDKFIKLGFSGINSKEEVEQYKKAGAKGVLVGTSLMKAKNVEKFIAGLRVLPDIKVKICGIRTLENAEAAIAAGADFLGFNFVPTSKRYINPKDAKKIIEKIRITNHELRIKMVGIFQNQSADEVNKIANMLDLDLVQLHGEEDEEYMNKVKRLIIKKVNHESRIMNQEGNFLILDRQIQGEGEMVDLEKAKQIASKYPTFFSGGLTPENVSEVVKKVKPFAVDVAGGIETDGEIDNEKVKLFIRNAKNIRHSGEQSDSRIRNVTAVRDSGQARMTERGKKSI